MAYSKMNEYDNEIKELVKKLLIQCDKHSIPVFLTMAVGDSSTGTSYITEMLSPAALGVKLKDDKIAKHALVVDGFEVVPYKSGPLVEELLDVDEVEQVLWEKSGNG